MTTVLGYFIQGGQGRGLWWVSLRDEKQLARTSTSMALRKKGRDIVTGGLRDRPHIRRASWATVRSPESIEWEIIGEISAKE